MRRGGFWVVSGCPIGTYRGMRSGENASRLGCALDLSNSNVPECRRRSLRGRKDSYAVNYTSMNTTTGRSWEGLAPKK
jgi:hypothetical protein